MRFKFINVLMKLEVRSRESGVGSRRIFYNVCSPLVFLLPTTFFRLYVSCL